MDICPKHEVSDKKLLLPDHVRQRAQISLISESMIESRRYKGHARVKNTCKFNERVNLFVGTVLHQTIISRYPHGN